jgi:FkbM family methyltransferase
MILTDITPLELLLNELRQESPEQAAKRVAGEFSRIAAPDASRIIIFGVGHLGKLALSGLRAAGVQPLAFCDNNARLWGTEVENLIVLSPMEAAASYRDNAAFVTAIYNASRPRQQLLDLGCRYVVPYPVLFWKYWRSMPKEDRLERPDRILARMDEIPPAYELLSDDISREEFCAQIRWRCLLDHSCLPAAHDASDMYFPPDLFRLSPTEAFVDCGAFDGDSIQNFRNKARDRFDRIVAIEADEANMRLLRRYCAGLPTHVADRIAILPFAISDRNGTVSFCAEGSVGSKVVETGATHEVACRTLDSILAAESPTLIKMDIEGAELDAIRGAGETIARSRPVIAACAYHSCDHLWIIPKLLKAASPDCRIFLRRYAEDCWETVYYAVPPERLINNN